MRSCWGACGGHTSSANDGGHCSAASEWGFGTGGWAAGLANSRGGAASWLASRLRRRAEQRRGKIRQLGRLPIGRRLQICPT
jgi:hypothetical protein